ncbi:MAG: hypothetical protein GC150_15720 [Rhizobiales bacterium]|nr:hypothetical protein [Hyphomicrobiales bacterium]
MKKIRLELARDHDFPGGSREHGYEMVAPIDDDGHIDAAEWRRSREKCRVVRFWGDADHEIGHLVRKPGGQWAFHYDIHGDEDDDETGHRFDSHSFRIGDYVSIKEHDDIMRTFRVVRSLDVAL